MTGFELECLELPLQERRAVPSVVLVLVQHVPKDDRQLARGCDRSDMFAPPVSDADEKGAERTGYAGDNSRRFDQH
jgi:hypothetical protein